MHLSKVQAAVVLLACLGLGMMYIFQRVDYAGTLAAWSGMTAGPNTTFVFNRTTRLLVNDGICFIAVVVLFKEQRFRKIALFVFAVELILLLPAYLILKLSIEGTAEISSPMLSFMHRLIVNPTLMVLTIIAMAYEKYVYPKFKG